MKLLLFTILLTSFNSYSYELISRIGQIHTSEQIFEPALVFLADGRVARLSPNKNDLLEELDHSRIHHQWVRLVLDDENEIQSVEPASGPDPNGDDNKFNSLVEAPTILSSLKEAQDLFNYARFKNKDSECFNRAHVWSYEWKTDKNINTSKMFLFFTLKYIREQKFHWWFHVAPYVHVIIGSEIKERIIDKKYLPKPVTLREWIDRFMVDGTKCRKVTAYSEYANYPETGHCYVMRSNMYTYWPLDLELEELKGITKTNWVMAEVQQAYLNTLNVDISGAIRK